MTDELAATSIAGSLEGLAGRLRDLGDAVADVAGAVADAAADEEPERPPVDGGRIAQLEAELAKLVAERDKLRGDLTASEVELAAARARIEELEAELADARDDEPARPPAGGSPRLADAGGLVVAGPIGLPAGTVLPRTGPANDHDSAPDLARYYRATNGWKVDATRGTAPIRALADDEMEITLSAKDWSAKVGGGTGMHHQWFYGPPSTELTVEFWHLFETPELGYTNKAGGFGTFGRDWPDGWGDFPAGDRRPTRTCLVRHCGWKYQTEDPAQSRLQDVIKTGHRIQAMTARRGDGQPARFWKGAEGSQLPDYSGGLVNDMVGPIPIGSWIGNRYVASWGAHGKPDGFLEVWSAIEPGPGQGEGVRRPWFLASKLTGIDWVQQVGPDGPGFNMVYFSWMYGGPDPSWAPKNPTQTGVRRFRDLAVKPGLVRPA